MSRKWAAIFATEVYRREYLDDVVLNDGPEWVRKVLRELEFHPNLRTNDGIDWQSAMGGGPVETNANLSGVATSTTATTLVWAGTFPTAGGYGNTASSPLAGKIVACGPNASGTGTTVYGVIVSNVAGTLTVDKWYNPQSPGGAAATTPNGTCNFQIITAMVPTWWMALDSTTYSPAATDHSLATQGAELTTNGFTRALGGWAHTNGTNTTTINNLFTCSGGSTTINNEGIFNATGTNGGIMTFESAEPSPPTLISADTLSQSVVITY